MQDRSQKANVLRYVVAKRWFPQLEVDVGTLITIGRKTTNITDIDVYASVPDDFIGFRTVVFDCKTRKGESPISRAMWQKGVMDRVAAHRGVCVLRIPKIETDHRYTAAQLGVNLLSEREFDAYATAMSPDYVNLKACVAEIERWEAFFDIGRRHQTLDAAIRFSRSGFWMSETAAEACIRTIFLMSSLRPELDPDKPDHLALVADLTGLLMHALARIVSHIFSAYLQPASQAELSRALLYFLYGGRSSYDHLNRIKRLIVESRTTASGKSTKPASTNDAIEASSVAGLTTGPNAELHGPDAASPVEGQQRIREVGSQEQRGVRDLSLPEWDRFVELVRQLLDAPLAVSRGPLLMREIAWGALGGGVSGEEGVSNFARRLSSASPQGARFAVLTLDYLCKAAALPREFNSIIAERLLVAQTKRTT